MKLPWAKRGNRHEWWPLGWIVQGDNNFYDQCTHCGMIVKGPERERWKDLPEFGCHARPIPAQAPVPGADGLPVAGAE